MAKGKKIRDRGKLKLSQYFKKISDGTSVALIQDTGINIGFPKRMIGKSGKVIGSRGACKLVELKDGNKKKIIIAHPIHLRIL